MSFMTSLLFVGLILAIGLLVYLKLKEYFNGITSVDDWLVRNNKYEEAKREKRRMLREIQDEAEAMEYGRIKARQQARW